MEDQVASWWSTVSLRTKITGVTVLLVTLGLIVAGFGTMTVLRGYLQDEIDSKVKSQLANIGAVSTTCQRSGGLEGYYLAVLDGDGKFICDNLASSAHAPVLAQWNVTDVKNMDGKPFTVSDARHTTQWRLVAGLLQRSDTGAFVSVIV